MLIWSRPFARSRSGAVFVGFGAIGVIDLSIPCSEWECRFGSAFCFVVGRDAERLGMRCYAERGNDAL
jgi:hypothetical protein